MTVAHILLLLACSVIVDVRYPLYYTDNYQRSSPSFDCLYAYLMDDVKDTDEPYIRNYHLIPYCIRPDNSEQVPDILNENVAKMFTFDDLRRENVTSTQLLNWSAPIGLVEQYVRNNESSSEVFYNCTQPWFGPMCQYKFKYEMPSSFGDFVQKTFEGRYDIYTSNISVTCYSFLPNCYRDLTPLCLDWREISDGKIHCSGGEDEQMCEELEFHTCMDDEYRCHYGGQCIPMIFVRDGKTSIDCLDGSDESEVRIDGSGQPLRLECIAIPTFRCEERTCRVPHSFSCGDGECVPDLKLPTFSKQCFNHRDTILSRWMFTALDHISNVTCQQALICLFMLSIDIPNQCTSTFENFVQNGGSCNSLDMHCSSKWISLPEEPIIYGFFQFVYRTNRSVIEWKQNMIPDLICFYPKLCPALITYVIDVDFDTELACFGTSDIFSSTIDDQYMFWTFFLNDLARRCLTFGTDLSCPNSSLFHCSKSSKCIGYHRLVDGFDDCYYNEDETFSACQLNDSQRFVCESDSNKCLSPIAIGNLIPDCTTEEDEMSFSEIIYAKRPPFSRFCDGFSEMQSKNETDETHCELWPCDNPYTHCDRTWNCLNGADELDCSYKVCSLNEHECRSNYFYPPYGVLCLPIVHLFDKYLNNCEKEFFPRQIYFNNETSNVNLTEYLRWNDTQCIRKDTLCYNHLPITSLAEDDTCAPDKYSRAYYWYTIKLMRTGEKICDFDQTYDGNRLDPFFITTKFGFFPSTSTNTRSLQPVHTFNRDTIILPKIIDIPPNWYCNRGIPILLSANETMICLCPPSYFGARCQWQSERVSLTLQVAFPNSKSISVVFQIIIMLIDGQREITSDHEKITYVPARDCLTKFNIYLLYPSRPKNASTNYSIHIDIYDRKSLEYYASWYLPIPSQFLPVNRISMWLPIPGKPHIDSCSIPCGIHGKCVRYSNKPSLFFCQCDEEYSGVFCNITHTCECSPGSLCLSPTICVCPLNKFGPYCYLEQSICLSSNNPCQHNGLCIASDDRISLDKFTCLCTNDYSGPRCEIANNRIDINIDKMMMTNVSSVLVHFIAAIKGAQHQRTTTFKKIAFDQNTITLYVTQPFHILFVELSNQNYYLTILREIFNVTEHIQAQVRPNQRCLPIHDLFNTTVFNYHPLHRIKYYPSLCRRYRQLMCLYDDIYMCICDLDRFANCFEFNHTMTYNCQGYNDCENGGHCFQNNATCPTLSMCICQECYYGSRCQFSTKGFIFSLDPILASYIKPNVTFDRQPAIVKVSIAIMILIFVLGLINGSLSILTFSKIKSKPVASIYYLLISSIISICTIIVLTIKFCHLMLSQMAFITNRTYLNVNCISIDMLLRTLVASVEWLNACVAMERLFTVHHGVSFNKAKSKQRAKWVIPAIFLMATITHIHDSIHRHLIDDFDADEQRTWCIVQYSSSFEIVNSIVTLFHFLVPFLINLIAAIFIIISVARNRSNAQTDISLKEHLIRQLRIHKHLLISSCTLVLLGLPRLIISFVSGCMRSTRSPWLLLVGYFVSFVPSILTFVVYVLPSEKYKKDFNIAFRKIIRRTRS